MKSTLSIGRRELALFAGSFLNGVGYPNPDDSGPVGPWGPVIHKALRNAVLQAGAGNVALHILAKKYPGLWDLWGGPVSRVALNPQPLPPRIVFAASLAQEVIDRALLIQDMAGALLPGKSQGAVGGYISRFTDDLCPDPPKIKIPKGPWPDPDPDPDPSWGASELMVIGLAVQQAAASFADEDVQKSVSEAGDKIMETAVSRI
jgi:hypothetical protein